VGRSVDGDDPATPLHRLRVRGQPLHAATWYAGHALWLPVLPAAVDWNQCRCSDCKSVRSAGDRDRAVAAVGRVAKFCRRGRTAIRCAALRRDCKSVRGIEDRPRIGSSFGECHLLSLGVDCERVGLRTRTANPCAIQGLATASPVRSGECHFLSMSEGCNSVRRTQTRLQIRARARDCNSCGPRRHEFPLVSPAPTANACAAKRR
jgi:hypothetical protein